MFIGTYDGGALSSTRLTSPRKHNDQSTLPARFRLRRSLLALKRDGGDRPIFRNLCVGAIIEVTSEVRDSGLVEVSFEGAIYTVFYADIVERGDAVNNDGGNRSSGQVDGAW